MDRDNAYTATQAKSGMTRRGVMRKTIIGSGAMLGVGYGAGRTGAIGGASAIAPLAVGSLAGAAALGYLISEGADLFLGDTRDYSNYTGADALHKDIIEGALEMKSANERVLTSINNNITNSKTVALTKGKAAALEAMNAGKSQSEATNQMQAAIDKYYSTIQENLLTHWEAQYRQIGSHFDAMKAQSDLSNQLSFYMNESDRWYSAGFTDAKMEGVLGLRSGNGFEFKTVTLLNGATYEQLPVASTTNNGDSYALSPTTNIGPTNYPSKVRVKRPGQDTGYVEYLKAKPFHDAWSNLLTSRDEANSTLSGFVGDVYAEYDAGDIPTEDLVDPTTAATELAQNYGEDAGQAAYSSMLGIPTTADAAITMEVHRPDGDVTLEADVYTEYVPPSGSFQKGTRYEPTTWDKPIYIAYEYADSEEKSGSDFVQLENPFTILEIISGGEEVDSFKPESQIVQTADVTSLQKELEQIREEQVRLQNKAETLIGSGGAGGGFFSGGANGIQNLGLVAAGGALIALLLGNR